MLTQKMIVEQALTLITPPRFGKRFFLRRASRFETHFTTVNDMLPHDRLCKTIRVAL